MNYNSGTPSEGANLHDNSEDKSESAIDSVQSPEEAKPQSPDLEAEIAQLKDQWMRAMAETENIRRRAQKDKEEASKYASANFGRDMLLIADNLRRALESCPITEGLPGTVTSLIQGVELTETALLSAFERYGIKKIFPLKEKFDPHLHQAMLEVEDNSAPPGTVIQVLQAGYMLHDRLLRPAMVGVSRQKAGTFPDNADKTAPPEQLNGQQA